MIRATTPTIIARIKNVDLTQANSVYVTIRQYGETLTLTGEDLDVTYTEESGQGKTEISFMLTQNESLGFHEGKAEIQVNWLYYDDGELRRGATKFAYFTIDKQILRRVLP